MKIGIIGPHGRLGSQLVHMGCEPIEYDILSNESLDGDWDVIINCAAKTKVDLCETDQKYYWEAVRVNGYGIDKLAANWEKPIIHISTDYVFGGKRGPYSESSSREDDLPTPKMSYGVTKFMGEQFAKLYNNVYIVRTTGLYGGVSARSDFLNLILDTFYIGTGEIEVAKDLLGNQTYIPHLAEALIVCAERLQNANFPHILHVASKEVISRYEFALMIASVFNFDKSRITPVKSEKVPGWIAERPKHGGLKVKLAQKLGLPIYTIMEGLEAYKDEKAKKPMADEEKCPDGMSEEDCKKHKQEMMKKGEKPAKKSILDERLERVEKMIADFVSQKPVEVKSEVVPEHELDAVFSEFKTRFDEIKSLPTTSDDKLHQLQEHFNIVGQQVVEKMKSNVEQPEPESIASIDSDNLVQALSTAMISAMKPVSDKLDLLLTQQAQVVKSPVATPTRRSIAPTLSMQTDIHKNIQPAKQSTSPTPKLHEIIRRSVG